MPKGRKDDEKIFITLLAHDRYSAYLNLLLFLINTMRFALASKSHRGPWRHDLGNKVVPLKKLP